MLHEGVNITTTSLASIEILSFNIQPKKNIYFCGIHGIACF